MDEKHGAETQSQYLPVKHGKYGNPTEQADFIISMERHIENQKKHVIGVYPQVGNRHSKKKPNSLDETLSPNFSWLDPSFGVLKSHGLAGKSLFYDIHPPVN